MTETEFLAMTDEGYNRVGLMTECLGDLDTPLSIYLKLANCPDSFLLESVEGGERFARYSFVGLQAKTKLVSRLTENGPVTEIIESGKVTERIENKNPLDVIEAFTKRFKVASPKGMPRLTGGLVGYFGYDTVRLIEPEKLAQYKKDDLNLPDICLLFCEELVVIDNLKGRIYIILNVDPKAPDAYAQARQRTREIRAKLLRPAEAPYASTGVEHEVLRPFAKEDYLKAVLRAKEYIAAGDCMQVQIGQRLEKTFTENPISLYRALRSRNPAPYMYYYNFGDHYVVGASPEILVRSEYREGKRIVGIRPIAGTRRRDADPVKDAALAKELLSDPKERAEHLMLIDLARNDIGRIAKVGSVKVIEQYGLERYSQVQHIVSHVEGELKDGMGNIDVLKATFPAGTLTGAPKVRAMEIIDELEPTKRGIYGGAVGYISFGGDMDLAIAIRTGVICNKTLYAQAAAGIVADSVPEFEHNETEMKARAVLLAARDAEVGLEPGF
ncbi:MAG: anthranilate synthase component I [Sutterellaceae bacterium]|nr:anthranilate synthase component I [Sutterellaceae bacterium]